MSLPAFAGSLFSCALSLALTVALGGCGDPFVLETVDASDAVVHILKIDNTRVALIEGDDGRILFDTSTSSATESSLPDALERLDLAFADIDRAIISHAHNDHGGGATFVQSEGVPVWLHAGDVDMASDGVDGEAEVIGAEAAALDAIVDHNFPPFTPDETFDGRLNLSGTSTHIIPTGGHTSGSVAAVVGGRLLLAADLVRGGLLAGTLASPQPLVHYFHEDKDQAHAALQTLLDEHPGVDLIWAAHGGPFTRQALQDFLDGL